MKKRIGLLMMVAALSCSMLACGGDNRKEKDKEKETTEESSNTDTSVDYSSYTESVPRSERDIEYYWNINTDAFDKTKFDGQISVFGTIMDTKLTGKTLKDAGFTFVSWTSEDGDATEQATLDYGAETNQYMDYGLLYKNDKVYPTYNYNVKVDLTNFAGTNDAYADSTEVFFNQATIYQDESNVIVPYIENMDYSKMTIDDIIDTLGVPTYVEGRTEKLEEDVESEMFNYVYVYDDYTFIFNFMYFDNTGISITGLRYMGSSFFAQPVEAFNSDTFENDTYDTYTAFLEEQYAAYQESIGKN